MVCADTCALTQSQSYARSRARTRIHTHTYRAHTHMHTHTLTVCKTAEDDGGLDNEVGRCIAAHNLNQSAIACACARVAGWVRASSSMQAMRLRLREGLPRATSARLHLCTWGGERGKGRERRKQRKGRCNKSIHRDDALLCTDELLSGASAQGLGFGV